MDVRKRSYQGIDRRKYPRVNAGVNYSVVEDADVSTSGSKNISAGGIAIFAADELRVDSLLSLSVRLPDMSDIRAKAKIVWSEPVKVSWDSAVRYEVGVEFVNIAEQDRQKISKYVFLRLDKD